MTGYKKKVLFIHHANSMGGAPTSMLNIIRFLDKNKFQTKILFIYNNPSIIEICKKENIDFRVLDTFFFRKIYKINISSEAKEVSWKYNLRIYPVIRNIISWLAVGFYYSKKIIKEENIDIVHFNSTFLTDWVWGVRNLKIKRFVHVREPLSSGGFGIKRILIRFIFSNYTDKVFAISEDNKTRLNLSNKTEVVYNFMKEPLIDCSKHKLPVKVAFLGGDSIMKGFNVIIESLPLLSPNIEILIAGEIKDENEFSKYQNLRYVGVINNIYEFLVQADLLIFPSLFPHFAKPIIEAGMCKLPVVASNVSGMNEIVKTGETGLLIKTGDFNELAKSINYLAENCNERKELGLNNYNFVKGRFSVEANLPIIEREYLS